MIRCASPCYQVLERGVNMLNPCVFAFLLIGSMLPYWFSAMTMKSVGVAAMEMVKEAGDNIYITATASCDWSTLHK